MVKQGNSRNSKYPSSIYRVSIKAVIRNKNGDVLVIKERDSVCWNLPGGGWEHDETEEQALARELHEEVGYEGEFTMSLMATQPFWLESKMAWLLWIVYEVTTENQNFKVGSDSSEIAFINPQSFKPTEAWSERWIYDNLKQ